MSLDYLCRIKLQLSRIAVDRRCSAFANKTHFFADEEALLFHAQRAALSKQKSRIPLSVTRVVAAR